MKISLLLTAGFYGRPDRRLSVLNTPLIPPAPVLGQQPVYFMRLSYRVYQKRELTFISFLDFPVPKEYDYLTAAVTKVFTELIASGYFYYFLYTLWISSI